MKTKTRTDLMIESLCAVEAVIAVLDQAASDALMPFSRLFHEQLDAAIKLRDSELKDWNEEATCGRYDAKRMIYRCDDAEAPYHMKPEDGPCEIYTANYQRHPAHGEIHLCDTCNERAYERQQERLRA